VVGRATRSRAREVRHPLMLVPANAACRPSDAPRHPRPLRAGLPLQRVPPGQVAPQRAAPRAAPRRDCRQTARTSEQAQDRRTASGIVGVCYSPDVSRARPWRAQIGVNKLLIHTSACSPRRPKLRPLERPPNENSANLVDAKWTSRQETRLREPAGRTSRFAGKYGSKPTPGLEPGTPSLRVKCSTS
jgi:hypothetical protein